MENEYFMWLVDSIDPEHLVEADYLPVLFELFSIPYIWEHPDDENRERDGLALRDQFADYLGLHSLDFGDKPCSVLEMLVAFATRIECSIMAMPGQENIPKRFWGFLENLKIAPSFPDSRDLEYVKYRIEGWSSQKFTIFSQFFPSFSEKSGKKNDEKMSIWSQFSAEFRSEMGF